MKVMEVLLNYLQAVDLGDCLAVMLVLSVPVALCLMLWFRSEFVATRGRLLLTILVFFLTGWGMVVCGTLIAPAAENGFAQVCAFFFGWAYPWIIGLPIMILALILRGLVALGDLIRRKVSGDEESSDDGYRMILTDEDGKEYTMEYYRDRSYANDIKTFNLTKAGKYKVYIIYFEYVETSILEVSCAKGSQWRFNSSKFKLLGTPEGGITLVGGNN